MEKNNETVYMHFGDGEESISHRGNSFSLDVTEIWYKDIVFQIPGHRWMPTGHGVWVIRMILRGENVIIPEDGALHLMKAGNFIIMPPDYAYNSFSESNSIIKCGMEFRLTPNPDNPNGIYHMLEAAVRRSFKVYNYSKRALQLFEQMLYLFENPGIDYEQNLLFLAGAFLMDLFNTVTYQIDGMVPTREARVDKACGFIQNTVTAQTTAGEVSEFMGLSARQLSRIFEMETGMTLGEYIADARQKKNRMLLMNPELTIADIAGQMHYNDASAFTRAFKRIEGVTPNQFRKAMKVFEK